MEIEDEVELADVSEVLVEDLDEGVNELEHDELVVGLVDDHDEVETGVTLVDYLVVLVVDEVAHFGFPSDDQLVDLTSRLAYFLEKPLLLLLRQVGGVPGIDPSVPFGQARPPVPADQKEAVDHL